MAFSIASRVGLKATKGRNVVIARAGGITKTDRSGDPLFFPTEQSLGYLDGTYAGDFGFDPLGLSDPEGIGGFVDPAWLRYAELIHGRWAMLGAAGCVAPEVLGGLGVIPQQTNILWFKTGVIPPAGTSDIFPMDPYALFWVQVLLMQVAELRRWQDFKNPGSMGPGKGQNFVGLENFLAGSGDPCYPGGPVFNFAGMAKEGEEAKTMRTKELRNGRLAMLAMFGFGAQAIMTGKGPIQNLLDHVSDPFNNNLLANFAHIYGS